MSFGRFIALGSYILTIGTIFLTYSVATSQNTAPLCTPFIDACTDITHTGMAGDAGFIFRGGLIARSMFLLIWWLINFVWLEKYTGKAGKFALYFATALGAISAVALVVSTATLVPDENQIPWPVHVYAANVFFQGTFIGLTILHVLTYQAQKKGLSVPSSSVKTFLMAGLWAMLLFYSGVTIGIELDHKNRIVEWWATLFISLYYLASFWDWKHIRLVAQD